MVKKLFGNRYSGKWRKRQKEETLISFQMTPIERERERERERLRLGDN